MKTGKMQLTTMKKAVFCMKKTGIQLFGAENVCIFDK